MNRWHDQLPPRNWVPDKVWAQRGHEMGLEKFSRFIHHEILMYNVTSVKKVKLRTLLLAKHPQLEPYYDELLASYITRNIGLVADKQDRCKYT